MKNKKKVELVANGAVILTLSSTCYIKHFLCIVNPLANDHGGPQEGAAQNYNLR